MANQTLKAIRDIQKKIENTLKEAIKPQALIPTAEEAIKIIVRRTRLGYGVRSNFGQRFKLPSFSDFYQDYRIENRNKLSQTTTPRKINNTFSGQLLDSIAITARRTNLITISPTGKRSDSNLSNIEVANQLDKRGRGFMRLSNLEYRQLIRFYRKTFGDLLKRRQLIR